MSTVPSPARTAAGADHGVGHLTPPRPRPRPASEASPVGDCAAPRRAGARPGQRYRRRAWNGSGVRGRCGSKDRRRHWRSWDVGGGGGGGGGGTPRAAQALTRPAPRPTSPPLSAAKGGLGPATARAGAAPARPLKSVPAGLGGSTCRPDRGARRAHGGRTEGTRRGAASPAVRARDLVGPC